MPHVVALRLSSKSVSGRSEPDGHSGDQWPIRWATAPNGAGRNPVFGVAIGPAGNRDVIVAGYANGTMQRWDAATGDPIGTPLADHTFTGRAVAIGQAGGREVIVAGRKDGKVGIWDAVTGKLVRTTPRAGPRGDSIGTFDLTGSVNSVAIGQAGGREVIVAGREDGKVEIWDAVTGKLIRRLERDDVWPADPVHAVVLCHAADRDLIAAGFPDRLWIWDVTDNSVRIVRGGDYPGECSVRALAAGRAGGREVIVSGSFEGNVEICDAATGDPTGPPLTSHNGLRPTAVAIGRAGDSDVIISGGYEGGTLRIWDAATGDPAGTLLGHDSEIHAVAIGRAGEEQDLIVCGHRDGTVTVREHHRGRQQP